MRFITRSVLYWAATASILFSSVEISSADSDLMVYPTRVVMNDRQRTAQVDLINTSQTKVSYKITLVRKRMTEAGSFQEVSSPQPAEKFADDIVKYSPRQVTLLPSASQTIRLMLKIPSELEEGEYRSHLLFSKMASGITDLSEKNVAEPGTVSTKVTINVGVSIPIIARHGKLDAKAVIEPSSVKVTTVEPNQQVLTFSMLRTGTRSVYGDFVVYRGDEKVAEANGLTIYTPNMERKFSVRVLPPYSIKRGETIKVVFTERDEKKPMAESIITLP